MESWCHNSYERNQNINTNWYLNLEQNGKVQAEYVWVGGSGLDMRSKSRTLDKVPNSVEELPMWNFDGSSTGQAPGKDSEVFLKPVAIFPDPFRGKPNILVLCSCWLPSGQAAKANHRAYAEPIFEKAKDHKPWFGMEQEYSIINPKNGRPLGYPDTGFPSPQGQYYCSSGAENAFGREIAEAHYRCCLYAGLGISGINAEVAAGQWEFQIGPVENIRAADEMMIARYMLNRVGEQFGVGITFHPKIIKGDWNGAGMHTNYSTEAMRNEGGYKVILEAINKLEPKHKEHMAIYGSGNEERMTGAHETASFDTFSFGVANRGASIRIPRQSEKDGKGYLEDRRPASNCDPYLVTAKITDTTCN